MGARATPIEPMSSVRRISTCVNSSDSRSTNPCRPGSRSGGFGTALEQFLRDLNDLGDLNLLFSDGRRLFCYHDIDGEPWTACRPGWLLVIERGLAVCGE